jgi:cold shock CspA family protein
MLQATVKKWFRDKNSGFLDNGSAPDILVDRADLVNCEFLKVGVMVEFECHTNKRGLIGKKVKLLQQSNSRNQNKKGKRITKEFRPGVMT